MREIAEEHEGERKQKCRKARRAAVAPCGDTAGYPAAANAAETTAIAAKQSQNAFFSSIFARNQQVRIEVNRNDISLIIIGAKCST